MQRGHLQMLKQLKKMREASGQKGFTIIEVLIVLAIAGLIMVVVFLAVPALQRSGRNNAINSDANAVLTAVGNYTSDNSGALPTVVTFAAPTVTVGTAGTNNVSTAKVGSGTAAITISANGGTAAITTGSAVGTIQVYTGTGAVCGTNGVGLSGGTTGSPRSYVVLYVAESGSGNTLKCIGG
jgi:prepilin-type N-terminal cleavage/methylation domain-containing protein